MMRDEVRRGPGWRVVAALALCSAAAVADDLEVVVGDAEACRIIVAASLETPDDLPAFAPSCWYAECAGADRRELGCVLSALSTVAELVASPDGRWLAVVSVGEGHPILELVEVGPLLAQPSEYRVILALNPYPGGFGEIEWQEAVLFVSSDMPLDRLPTDGTVGVAGLLPEDPSMLYRIEPLSGLVEMSVPRDASLH